MGTETEDDEQAKANFKFPENRVEDPSPVAVESRDSQAEKAEAKIEQSLTECLNLAQNDTDREDVKYLFRQFLTGSSSVDKTERLRGLTPDNIQILEARINRVSEYAKLHMAVSHTGEAWQEAKGKFTEDSKEYQAAQKAYKDTLESYNVARAMVAASDVEVIKYNDPNLEDDENLRRTAFELDTATKYTDSVDSLPYSQQEIRAIRARSEAKNKLSS
ncbi:MAG: hypothetical protein A3J07_00910 [Candidatus Doudnabacteria bacterium RIFCSPLOWO2_02_FULL_49_13]|uniref:Uncharacterized protein n=1 Tax=Candidatus Doudnabacteria bacterium RIFCSPHIGHO2_12_FULL_48_16 TaxID=1817838 RepID=A0A1F5PK86_9BACT|nr:MAG: hypothetical protein A3B77_04475 [Candidatus Doudnabacteria bacterium RIFCSPHIGHO2_02_FULL_49_24]OGE89910.1 MAG: hypothetical protein A2760_04370 [Candidatus Doudnabacteria bacterium RIFCSPHIGHO2_01_FULL_50_67]OGE90311.1 MAG: hypothetical protein A3E29_04420 [Candidatus Doudnabacteria bacterium RIFCSPHIGHO2_12_FULL_48_16]OGE96739.1 MAG: hypothetical protein A2990_00410 [Candidatus Doudnabacteria bacterium RIFCSPLOWO2_01_FULL_49_40]OGF02367.1 MAG: hypothetical protein A3J07_00910 [Candid